MTAPVRPTDVLQQLLAGQVIQGLTWPAALGLVEAVTAERSDASDAALRSLALHEGPIALDPSGGHPHSTSPEVILRMLAVQELGRRDPAAHRDVLQQVADSDVSERLASMALVFLMP